MPYFTRSPANYGKTLKKYDNDYGGSGDISQQVYYNHLNGDIEFFWMLVNGSDDHYHYLLYKANEEKLYLKIDTIQVYPEHYSEACWFNRYMNVGDVIYNSNNIVTAYDSETGQIYIPRGPPDGHLSWPHKIKFQSCGTANLGGNLGTVDYIIMDYCWGLNDNCPIERNTFVKDLGWVRWQFIFTGASAWQEDYSYVNGDTIYQPDWSYGGVTGLSYAARIDHFSSQANKPDASVVLSPEWLMIGPARWLNSVVQTKELINYNRMNPNWVHPPGPYLRAENGGGNGGIIVDRANPAAWEQFAVEKLDTNKYAIKTYNGWYISAEGNGGGNVNTNYRQSNPDEWEWFSLYRQADGYYAIKTWDGIHYLCAEGGGEQLLNATRTAIGAWEKFGFHQVSGNVYNIWTYYKDVFGPEFVTMPSLSILP